MKLLNILIVWISVFEYCFADTDIQTKDLTEPLCNTISIPSLAVNGSNTHDIAKAFRIAIGDIMGNIQYHKSGLLDEKKACLYAGLLYGKPWTRDTAINIWNGFALLSPETSKNTLMAQVEKNDDQNIIIGGQYWDKIIWAIGAWEYYLYTGDKDFLNFSFEIIKNTLAILEKEEFSDSFHLFRGPAVYGDGVAAYPDIYTKSQNDKKSGSYSGIFDWVEANPGLLVKKGVGLPMCALSTNCVYYQAYKILDYMAKELDTASDINWRNKAESLYNSINEHFWNTDKNTYNYLIDPFGNCDAQEGLGISFALLFGVADQKKAENIFKNTVIEPAGIPCLYPTFKRYRNDSLDSYGRHSGTVWPHVEGFWAEAAKKYSQYSIFLNEFNNLTAHALRDFQFVEIYHPKTGLPYGGIQEPSVNNWTEWFCAERQTWSATAYLRMVLRGLFGMEFNENGITFQPYLPENIHEIVIYNLKYRNANLDIKVTGKGKDIAGFKINGVENTNFVLKANAAGKQKIEIELKEN